MIMCKDYVEIMSVAFLSVAQKKLVVGFSEKISIMDLRTCQDYNNSCADCVLARDPYCAWTEVGCTPTVP